MECSYSDPAEAARIPGLAAWLDSDRAAQRGALVDAAERDKAAAEKNDFPYHAHSHLETWQRITDTPRFLSLSSEIATYMGGAHGMQSFDSLIWDRKAAKRLKPSAVFETAAAFENDATDEL